MGLRTAAIFVNCLYLKSDRAGAYRVDDLFGIPPPVRSQMVVHGAEHAQGVEGRPFPEPDDIDKAAPSK